ncbi:outer membrane beta-barrel protein [Leptothrix ochracea]|uniref:outer membrane beta-barrel protein n=1 Tax=Leptothrix ochracea TaxID=735331 RepID=UPI0034E1EC03
MISKQVVHLLVGSSFVFVSPMILAADAKSSKKQAASQEPVPVKCECTCTLPSDYRQSAPENVSSAALEDSVDAVPVANHSAAKTVYTAPQKIGYFPRVSSQKSESSPIYVQGGVMMVIGYDTGYYVSVGKNMGLIKNHIDVDWTGDLLIEGSYETGSKSITYPVLNGFGLTNATAKATYTQISLMSVYRQKTSPNSKWSYTVAAGLGKQDVKVDYSGTAATSASNMKFGAAVGLRYIYSPVIDVDIKYYATGLEGYRAGVTYRF